MCGIVGHIGKGDSVEIVLEGLSRLEYRGYDSAGICIIDEKNNLKFEKKAGKLQVLKDHLISNKLTSNMAIGHTRWATHGQVTDNNAHPHVGKRLGLVHNGIIENYQALKEDLIKEGESFSSETDSEVFMVLVERYLKSDLSFLKAVTKAFESIRGNSAFVILDKKTRQIACVKRAAPLVCGVNNITQDLYTSSDPYALVGMANSLYFPDDDVIGLLKEGAGSIEFFELDGAPSKRYLSKEQSMSLQSSDKGDFEHFMLKEIYEQPSLMVELLTHYQSEEGSQQLDQLAKDVRTEKFHLVACGTAYHAGLVLKNLFEKNNKIETNVELASEFRYRNPLLKKSDIGFFISQSGETADTLAAKDLCTDNKLKTFSLVNVEGSTLYRECEYNLLIRAGFEIGVASTKAFTQQVLTGLLFSKALSGEYKENKLNKEIALLSDRFKEVLGQAEVIKEIAEKLHDRKGYIFTGRGSFYPIALEGALKLKEIAYVHAEGYAAGELKHGPIALIDPDMVNVAIVAPELYEKTVSNVEEVKARRGTIFSIAPKGDKSLREISDFQFEIDYTGLDETAPLLANLVLQLFSYYVALYKGTDIDKPRNLAKSVTVE